jgi:lipoyl(octanoyl) transferase
MTTWRLLDSGAMSPSLNMGVDQAILGLHANGKSPPTLRFYQWNPPAVSLGYCQKNHNLNLEACRRLGIEVVRRPSGGRAVLHLGDLTYAVIAGTADGMPSAVTAAYRLICDGLLSGFRRLGIEARMGRGVIKPPQMDICFLRGTLGSIVYQERKFVGSAQTWHASSMLQHGSIILASQIEALVSLWPGMADSPEARQTKLEGQITSLQEILGRLPEVAEVKAAIREGLARTLEVRFDQGDLTPGEWALAQDMANQEVEKESCPTRISPRSPSVGSGSASPA